MKAGCLKVLSQIELTVALRLSLPHVDARSHRLFFHPSRCRPHPFLVRVVAAQHDGQRAQDDFEIEQERPVLYIEKIKTNHFIKR